MAVLNNGPIPPVKGTSKWTCFGYRLQTQLEAWSLTNLALLGHGMETGEVSLTQTTPRQTVAVIPRVTMALLRTVRRATPLDYAAMKRGTLTVEALHEEQLTHQRLADAAVDKTLLKIGLDRVLAALERLTSPTTNGAAVPANGHDVAVPANDNTGNNGVTVAMPDGWWQELLANA